MQFWRNSAVCAVLDLEEQRMFFGDATGLSIHKQHEYARMSCYQCPVQVECLAYSIEIDAPFGVWGGLTESQRKRYLAPRLREAYRSNTEVTPEILAGVILLCGSAILKKLSHLALA